jgi:2-amino-4-hydroxy-6-hydroxymethyldihydropteridine diphosphokinase
MPKIVYFALGSNLGDRERAINSAIEAIRERIGPILKTSNFYRTAPLNSELSPDLIQPEYINAAVSCETSLGALEILEEIKKIESELGRKMSDIRWGPREIDIDIISLGDEVVDLPNLKIPHNEMTKRDFVLRPLHNIAPEWIHPESGESVQALLERLDALAQQLK